MSALVGEKFTKVLIANRGEIAIRVIRACQELGLNTVAVYGAGEQNALHVRRADDAYLLPDGPMPYLNIDALIEVALSSGAGAVHPGYGFLAENGNFAEACGQAGLRFVGPSSAAIRAMGDKVTARKLALAAGVSVVPGSDGPVSNAGAAVAWAERHGFPIAVKASAGGGGRGFRVARERDDVVDAFAGSSGEALRYFGNPEVYLERYLDRPRHIEMQLFADDYGNVVWMGERECSIQRRHQKLIEETPSPVVTEDLRAQLGAASVALARAVDYRNAGTCEFLLTADGSFYFLEMNTRIQVEHTITEEVTGIDLVQEQLRVAMGMPLSFRQENIVPRGSSIQCRINAEDAGNGFKPTPGVISKFRAPEGFGIRVDTAMEDGAEIPPQYDSLIAKLVVYARDRDEAIRRMNRALNEFEIEGVPTLISFHRNVIKHPLFQRGAATTSFLEDTPELIPEASQLVQQRATPTSEPAEMVIEVDGHRLNVAVHGLPRGTSAGATSGRIAPKASGRSMEIVANSSQLVSPIQGTVVRLAVSPNVEVRQGDLVCVVEAMKMENELLAHREGTIASLPINIGDTVRIGTVLATIE